jgi:hypothetical protein
MNFNRATVTGVGILAVLSILCVSAPAQTQKTVITIQAAKPGKPISPDLIGVFFEDLNYAADGGLYASGCALRPTPNEYSHSYFRHCRSSKESGICISKI